MKKEEVRYIREVAGRLPKVQEQTISGYYLEDGEPKPNIVVHDINHERRLRKAYESLGMQGIKDYLEWIHKLQLERKDANQRTSD